MGLWMAGAEKAARMRARRRERYVPASPTRISSAAAPRPGGLVELIRRREAAREAVESLARERPAASAKHALARGRRIVLALVATGVPLVLAAPELVWLSLVALASIGFAALTCFRICAASTHAPAAPPPGRSRTAPPVYTIIVALHDEAAVASNLIAALRALDYPRDRLDVKLVLEADDAATIAAVEAHALRAPFEVLLVPPGQPRTKPRALNYALSFARGEIVVIYDAEDRPAPGQLKAALDAFDAGDARLACVQAPLSWYNAGDTWLTRQFALEYAALFHVVLPALAHWGWPLPLGGTSNHFRRAALDHAGGWDPFNVTEDADLGFRLAELGYTSTVIAPGTREEAVTTIKPWIRQRSRWIKGFLQTLLVRLANLPALARNAGWKGFAALALTIALPLASSFVHGPMAVFAAVVLVAGGLPPAAAAFLAAGYAVAAATAYIGLARSNQRQLAFAIPLMPLYWPLQSLAALRALRDLAARPFHWEKTQHGVSGREKISVCRPCPRSLTPQQQRASSPAARATSGAAARPQAQR